MSGMPISKGPVRFGLALALALLTAGCFQPLYGDRAVVGGAGLNDKLASVQIPQIDIPNGSRIARVGNVLRDQLMYDFTGGGAAASPTHKLVIKLTSTQLQVIVDINTARPDIQNYGIDATYQLIDLSTGKIAWQTPYGDMPQAGPSDQLRGNIFPKSGFAVLASGLVVFVDNQGMLYALDQKTGKVKWSTNIEKFKAGFSITSAPLYYNGKVYVGGSGGEYGIRGRLTAPSRIAPGVYDVVGTAWRHQDSAQGAG